MPSLHHDTSARGVEEIIISEGDLVSLLSEARVISDSKNSAHIFIQDKTNNWIRKKDQIKNRKWSKQLVNYRMRNGFKKMDIGFYWEPAQDKDILELMSAKIYLKPKEK